MQKACFRRLYREMVGVANLLIPSHYFGTRVGFWYSVPKPDRTADVGPEGHLGDPITGCSDSRKAASQDLVFRVVSALNSWVKAGYKECATPTRI